MKFRWLAIPALAAMAVFTPAVLPASAAPARPEVHSTNCDITVTFCNILANYTANWWVYGTLGNQGIIAHTASDQYWWRARETGWGILELKTGACLQFIPSTGQITPSSCSSGTSNHNELWNIASGPSGSSQLSVYSQGTGDRMWVDNVDGVYVQLAGGQVAGNELYFRA